MRKLLSLLLLSLPAFATPPVVSSVGFSYVGQSSATVFFTVSGSYNDVNILYAASPNTCTSGGTTGGGTTSYSFSGSAGYTALQLVDLTPGGTYQVCPEVSNDSGSTWSSGVGATLALKPATSTLRKPVAPASMDTSYPDLTQGTCWQNSQPGACAMVVSTPCQIGGPGNPSGPVGTVNNDIGMAIKNQAASSTIVEIPAGQTCNDAALQWNVSEPDGILFDPGQVQNYSILMGSALSTYTAAGQSGITEGLGLRFEPTAYDPTVPLVTDENGSWHTLPDYLYFVHVTGTNSFELYWPYTHIESVSLTNGGNTIHVGSLVGQGGATAGVLTGAEVVGNGIPANTTVTAISGSDGAYTITLSAAATITAVSDLSFGGGDASGIGVTNNMPLQIVYGNTWVYYPTYPVNYKVSYNGQVWIATQSNAGQTPQAGSAYWALSSGLPTALSGAKDESDDWLMPYPKKGVLYWVDVRSCVTGVNCIASWNSGTAYSMGDFSTVGGEAYEATAANANQMPPNATYWKDLGPLASFLDSTLPPEGVRMSPQWAPNLATLEAPNHYTSRYSGFGFLIPFTYGDGGGHYYSNMRFTGLQIINDPNAAQSSDPHYAEGFASTPVGSTNIIFDRILSATTNPANRSFYPFMLQGHGISLVNNYFAFPVGWTAGYTNVSGASGYGSHTAPAPSPVSSTSFTVPATTVGYGANAPATLASPLTVSWTGTPSASITEPEIMVYFDMNGNLNVVGPQGITITAPGATISYTATAGNMACTSADPLTPIDPLGPAPAQFAALACAQLTSAGVISGSLVAGSVPTFDAGFESCACILAGVGPGPYAIENNYMSSSGIMIHFDNAGGNLYRNDYTIQRNTFHFPMNYLNVAYNQWAQAAGITSTGMMAGGHEQPLEWKGGSRILIDGNEFNGWFHGDGSGGFAFDMTPSPSGSPAPIVPNGTGGNDVTIDNNIFEHGPNGITCPGSYVTQVMASPANGCWIVNNLFWDINGLVYAQTGNLLLGSSGAAGYGEIAVLGNGEDDRISHNTIFQQYGTQSIFVSGNGMQGVEIDSNIIPYSYGGIGQYLWDSGCGSHLPSTVFNACFHATFAGNVIVPGYSQAVTYPPSGAQYSASQIASDLGTFASQNTILASNSDPLTTFDSMSWRKPPTTAAVKAGSWDSTGNYIGTVPDFRLLSQSTYNFGQTTDGLQEGANIGALEAAQGKVTLVGPNQITSTAANITYVAPDSDSCAVDYGSSDPTLINSFTRVQDAGGARVRNVALTGLTPGTEYYFRVDCAVEQPTGKFATK